MSFTFLASVDLRFITGINIPVKSGVTVSMSDRFIIKSMDHFRRFHARWKSPLYKLIRDRHLLLLAALAVALAVCGVVELTDDVLEGDTQALDETILHWFRRADGAPVGPAWLLISAQELTALGSHSVLTLIFILATGVCLMARRVDVFAMLAFSGIGATIINFSLKSLFARPRPSIVEPLVEVSTFSYPSGHALMSFAIYLSFAAVTAELAANFRIRAYLVMAGLLIAGIVGLTRVYLGVHYPSDVLAGWAIGGAWALLCWIVAVLIKERRHLATSLRR